MLQQRVSVHAAEASAGTVNSNFAIFKFICETMAGGNWFNGYKQVK